MAAVVRRRGSNLLVSALLLSVPVPAAQTASEVDDYSYALGMHLGRQLLGCDGERSRLDSKINYDQLLAGLKDTHRGRSGRMSLEEARRILGDQYVVAAGWDCGPVGVARDETRQPDEIFSVVDEPPRFPGCPAAQADPGACDAERKLNEFIDRYLEYPPLARENGVEGTVVVDFVVDTDGRIRDPRVVRDIGAGCGRAALRVVELMNKLGGNWTPGRLDGRPVSARVSLPVRFRLDE